MSYHNGSKRRRDVHVRQKLQLNQQQPIPRHPADFVVLTGHQRECHHQL
jgi:hypothetical protein